MDQLLIDAQKQITQIEIEQTTQFGKADITVRVNFKAMVIFSRALGLPIHEDLVPIHSGTIGSLSGYPIVYDGTDDDDARFQIIAKDPR